MEALLTDTLVSEQLCLRPPSQNPVFLTSHKNFVFFHSLKRPAQATNTFFASWGCPLTRASTVVLRMRNLQNAREIMCCFTHKHASTGTRNLFTVFMRFCCIEEQILNHKQHQKKWSFLRNLPLPADLNSAWLQYFYCGQWAETTCSLQSRLLRDNFFVWKDFFDISPTCGKAYTAN